MATRAADRIGRAIILLTLWAHPLGVPGLGLTGAGRAYADRGDVQVSFAPSFVALDFDQRRPPGVGLAIELDYGLSDAWQLRGVALGSAHPTDGVDKTPLTQGTIAVLGGFVGLRYIFDLTTTVPYLDLGLGVLSARGAGSPPSTELAYQVGIGFYRYFSRRMSWGIAVSYHGFLSDPSTLPVYLYAGPRIGWHWP